MAWAVGKSRLGQRRRGLGGGSPRRGGRAAVVASLGHVTVAWTLGSGA